MQYFGGKAKTAKYIAPIINSCLRPGQIYREPFCGGLNVTALIRPDVVRIAQDANPHLMVLYRAIQQGWEIPDTVTEEEYDRLKADPQISPLKTFAGFACSFGGKWFGGFARDERKGDVTFVTTGKRGLLKKFETLQSVAFSCGDFFELNTTGEVIYCDPPYAGTTGYSGVPGRFDSKAFWQKVRDLTDAGNLVFVSEYEAPDDFTCLWSLDVKTDMKTAKGERIPRTEKLFYYI